jgi:uncharacterized membrane protein
MRHLSRHTAVLALTVALTACPQKAPEAPANPAPADTAAAAPAPSTNPGKPDMASGNTAPQGKRAAGEENAPLQAWRGFGTEPFWDARVEGDTLVFSTPDDQEGRRMQGRRVPSLVGYVFIGKDGDKDFNLGLTPGECSDGMSDNRYAFTATFTYGGTTYKGCGEEAK